MSDPVARLNAALQGRYAIEREITVMDLTPDEQPVVRRAVAAYLEMKDKPKGPFGGTTANEILDELKPSPARWTELAVFVIDRAEGPEGRKR